MSPVTAWAVWHGHRHVAHGPHTGATITMSSSCHLIKIPWEEPYPCSPTAGEEAEDSPVPCDVGAGLGHPDPQTEP